MEITTADLKEKIKNGDKIIVDFWATWCGPCKVMKPMFESAGKTLLEQNSEVQLYTFNIEKDMDLVSEMGIRSVPTIKGFSEGKSLFSEVGVKNTNVIMEMTKKLL
jgi:thioredoxin 1